MKCLNCNAEIQFQPGEENLYCPYCGNKFDPSNYKSEKDSYADVELNNDIHKYKTIKYGCKNCGAELLTTEETAVTFCSYCGSNQIIKEKLVDVVSPKYIIPFKITKEEAVSIYKRKINRFFLAPSYMKDNTIIKKIRGIYMPYGIYSSSINTRISNNGSKYAYHRRDFDYYNDYEIKCNLKAKYQGISFDLLSKFYDSYSEKIGPFNFKKAKEFNENYLAGYYADSSDVDCYNYEPSARMIISNDVSKELRKCKEFKKYGCDNPQAYICLNRVETAYYPVYFLSILNKKKNKIFYATINGQTGKVYVDMPISFIKYVLLSLILSIGIYFIIQNFEFTPKILLIVGIILHILSLIFEFNFANRMKIKKSYLDDLGMLSYNESTEQVEIKYSQALDESKVSLFILGLIMVIIFLTFSLGPLLDDKFANLLVFVFIAIVIMIIIAMIKVKKSRNISYKIKVKNKEKKHISGQLIGIILSIIVLFSGTIHDEYYYVASLISLLLLIFTYYDLAKRYNELVSRKIPQLEKRGGDEYE